MTGIRAQICGDSHLLSLGSFATPERRLTEPRMLYQAVARRLVVINLDAIVNALESKHSGVHDEQAVRQNQERGH